MAELVRDAVTRCQLCLNEVDLLQEFAALQHRHRWAALNDIAQRLDMTMPEIRTYVRSLHERRILKRRGRSYVVNMRLEQWDRRRSLVEMVRRHFGWIHRYVGGRDAAHTPAKDTTRVAST